MKLLSTEHYLFKRFKLNPIKLFKYEPQNLLTFIIGTNGSGKSSLIEQWDPSPKSASDYHPGGWCKQKFLGNDGSIYELRSEFDLRGGAKHHFIRDGEPLNNGTVGGTGKVQKQLVERYFNFDKDLHKILRGETSFTKMTPQQRQMVITEISNCDLSYAFKVYNAIQSNLRNTKGTQRDLASVIARDKDKLVDMNIDEVEKQRNELKERLRYLSSQMLASVKNNIDSEKEEYLKLEGVLLQHLEQAITGVNSEIDTLGLKSEDELTSELTACSNDIQKLIAEITMLSDRASKLDSLIDSKEKELAVSGDRLDSDITELERELVTVKDFNPALANTSFEAIEQAISKLSYWLSEHSGLENCEISPSKYETVVSFLKNYPTNFKVLESELGRVSSWLDHADNHQLVNCPKCSFSFSTDLDLSEKPAYLAKHEKYKKLIETMTSKKLEGEDIVKSYESNLYKRRSLLSIIEGIDGNDAVFSLEVSVNQFYHQLTKRLQEIKTNQHNAKRTKEIKERLTLLWELRKNNTVEKTMVEVAQLKEEFNSVLANVEERQDKLLVLEQRHKALKEIHNHFTYQQKLMERVNANVERLTALSNDIMKYECNQFVEKLMEEIHLELSKTQQAVTDYQTLTESIRRFEEVVEEAKYRQEDLERLATAMSPSNGIIAAQLTEHINVIIAQMNSIIGNVWEHHLEILPCGIEEESLNYQFPMEVADDDDIVPDISKGSKGQREIIDLAFTIVLMMQRDLSEYPMYLDEIASSFDKKHRVNFMKYLNELVSNKKISQIFMINHYSDMYGIVGEHDVVVIDKTNVVVPENYNLNVVIE